MKKQENLKYKYENRSFWLPKYYVSTVGLNQKTFENRKQTIELEIV